MFSFDITFLENKLGKFDKEYIYPRISLIEGSLIYVEKNTKEELDNEINQIKNNESLKPTYIWGYVNRTNAIYLTRSFGENKVFIYNPHSMVNTTEYIKGKLKVLKNLQRDTIDSLFDQKAVFDYFYKKLWDIRLELGKEIRNKNGLSDSDALMEAQHIIDRIIFTYFVCEKDLVFVKTDSSTVLEPIKGNILFSDILDQISSNTWDYLKHLFFEQFAKSGVKELDCGDGVYIKTPYLNGGLFRPKTIGGISEEDLVIEYNWNSIFEPLNKYSWIIEDNISDLEGEYEGNLTPEIIGHIYEKFVISIETLNEINLDELKISKKGYLIKGNKKIGAYYTPELVTDYISRNTITLFLYEKLGIKSDMDFNDFLSNSNIEILNKSNEILNQITICDPGCGSGAFLIKAGEILLEYKVLIQRKLGKENISRYNLKKEIIVNNIFGVDIQEGAVEICKLRLWLWLISSSHGDVEPLPNIEYNFVVGNSLVGWTKEELKQSVLFNLDKMVLVVLDALKIHYKDKIDDIKRVLLKKDMQSYAKAMSLLKDLYSYSTEGEAEQLKIVIESIRKPIYDKINGVFYDYIRSEGIKITRDEYDLLEPLHWMVDFNEIFLNDGFDIVIGNPPYLTFSRVSGSKGIEKKLLKSYKEYLTDYYTSSAEYKISTYAIFMNKGISLLNKDGFMSYITPDSFLIGRYYSKLRNFIMNTCKIERILLFREDFWKVGVIGFPVIAIFKKEDDNVKREDNNLTAICTKSIKAFNKGILKQYCYPQNYFRTIQYNRFRLFFDQFSKILVEKIESKSLQAGDVVSLHVGIRPRIGYKNISSKTPKDDKWKKGLIKGNEITHFNVNYCHNYINLDPDLLWAGGFDKDIIKQDKLLMRKTGDSLITALDTDGLYHLDIMHSIVLKDKKYDLKFLMALFNSKLLNHYYHLTNLSLGRVMAQTNMETVEKLPIRLNDNQDQIVNNINKVINIKNSEMNERNKFINYLKKDFNIEKLPNKLEKYYELSEDDFFKVLIDNKIEINSKDNVSRKFNKSLSILVPFIKNSAEIISKIDYLIYKMYDLSETDIELIEKDFRIIC
ncbi:Eco57I restriction-modification methylase domain-containing protein [Methanobacterium spitsbergense]|uniref:site-specific DNA-methyltransferase (adenine-specific) n=1 Tax=Methanobacterium spitsbergense TaxID=2874285 RepID=A0A8T5UY43_9EURY|nr:TaqI-like C-terminal specificity domain-containing protein [Methanobacterium spitsbergense]MBZ2164491.1 Eco57I restriction-modification methylase domain-containing protein [Methanobacterium spitsbergense]